MKKYIGKLILFFFGWKTKFPTEFRFPKMLMIAAPYTSKQDFIITFAAFWSMKIYPKFLFDGSKINLAPTFLLKMIGGINANQSIVKESIVLFNSNSEMVQIISPEGRIDKVDRWKTGFFHIATKADVPICLGTLDYEEKIAGIGELLNMSGDFGKDLQFIEDFYSDCKPKYPEKYNSKIF